MLLCSNDSKYQKYIEYATLFIACQTQYKRGGISDSLKTQDFEEISDLM